MVIDMKFKSVGARAWSAICMLIVEKVKNCRDMKEGARRMLKLLEKLERMRGSEIGVRRGLILKTMLEDLACIIH